MNDVSMDFTVEPLEDLEAPLTWYQYNALVLMGAAIGIGLLLT